MTILGIVLKRTVRDHRNIVNGPVSCLQIRASFPLKEAKIYCCWLRKQEIGARSKNRNRAQLCLSLRVLPEASDTSFTSHLRASVFKPGSVPSTLLAFDLSHSFLKADNILSFDQVPPALAQRSLKVCEPFGPLDVNAAHDFTKADDQLE